MTRIPADFNLPAGIARRIAAFAADCLGVSIVLTLVTALILALDPAVRGSLERLPAWHGTITSVVGALYFVACWRIAGATPGQRAFGLWVRRNEGASPISLGRGLARWAVLGGPLWIGSVMLPGLPGFLTTVASAVWAVILLVTTARNAEGRGMHDRLADTSVVRAVVRRA